jgi:hypothetical protein
MTLSCDLARAAFTDFPWWAIAADEPDAAAQIDESTTRELGRASRRCAAGQIVRAELPFWTVWAGHARSAVIDRAQAMAGTRLGDGLGNAACPADTLLPGSIAGPAIDDGVARLEGSAGVGATCGELAAEV